MKLKSQTQQTNTADQPIHEKGTLDKPNTNANPNNQNQNSIKFNEQHENNNSIEREVGSKRKRKAPENWKKNIRKKKRNSGEEYVTPKGETKAAKEFKDFTCFCPLKCSETVPVESRKKCFDKFYSCGSWEIQTMYIAGHVKSQAVLEDMAREVPVNLGARIPGIII